MASAIGCGSGSAPTCKVALEHAVAVLRRVRRPDAVAVDEPHHFRMQYDTDPEGFTARAIGDLDCDGTELTFALRAQLHDGTPHFSITKPSRAD